MKLLEARDERGRLICMACRKKYVQPRKPCRTCGKLDILARDLCKRHYDARLRAARPTGTCIDCGRKRPLQHGRCTTCDDTRTARVRVDKALRRLLGEHGRICHPQLRKLFAHLTQERRPLTVERWLRRLAPEVRAYLHRVRDGVLTQADLAQLRAFVGGAQLVSSCRRAGLFLDAALDVINAYVEQLMERAAPASALILRQYWQCYVTPQVRDRLWIYRRTDLTLRYDRTRMRIAADFLAYVVDRSWELLEISDDRIRQYVSARPRAYAGFVAAFCRWLRGSGRVRRPIAGPAHATRHARGCTPHELGGTLYRACRDEQLPLDVRVALLFVILARQPLHRCVALDRRALRERGGDVLAVHFAEGVTWRLRGQPAALIRAFAAGTRR